MAEHLRMITDWAPRDYPGFTPEQHMEKMLGVGKIGSRMLYFNPLVSVTCAVLIWVFVIYAMVEQEEATADLQEWQGWVTDVWNWFYMFSQNVWIVVLFYVCYKYWGLKLGKEAEKPEFDDVSYFAMLFSCGVATGLWYYTAEAMWHYEGYGGPRWTSRAMYNDNTKAEYAMMVTFFHWGLHGWIPYVTMGVLIAILTYRRGFPMSIRWTLYPIIGDMCYGIVGDFVEILSILCTVFGVCTSLGLGAMQVNKGLVRLDQGTYRGVAANPEGALGIEFKPNAQVWIIACITILATLSLVLGLARGIKWLANIAFGLSFFLLISVLFLDETWYILNANCSAFGYYLWSLPKISFHTDAWEELGSRAQGLGGAPDNDGGKKGWMNGWTIFYWGWWISWSPFVGTFIARISRGRKVGPVIVASLVLPSLWSFAFMGVFGAAQIRIENQAITSTQACVERLPANGTITPASSCYLSGYCKGCSFTYGSTADKAKFGWNVPADAKTGVAAHWRPVDEGVVRLYNLGTEDVLFEHLGYYGGKGWATFATVAVLLCIVLYFVTSSDSASYVVDILAANGQAEPPLAQKIFWALTEGAAASALLLSADEENPSAALNAVKVLPIVLGLPYTFHLFWCCQSLLIICKEEAGEIPLNRKNFKNFLLFNLQPMSAIAIVAPFLPLGISASKAFGVNQILCIVLFALEWAFFLVLLCLGAADEAFLKMAAAAYICFTCTAGAVRAGVRGKLGITGDLMSDLNACTFWLPFCMGQMAAEDFTDLPVEKDVGQDAGVAAATEPKVLEEAQPKVLEEAQL